MTKKLFSYFIKLGFSPDELGEVVDLQPEIENMEIETLISNVELVISYGYPRCDISTLIELNPTFLLLGGSTLKERLDTLTDVEFELKQNPYLI